jgi:ABC-type nitrate/sulfonate/bicarbonate transport system ATPase subunit
MPSKGASIFDLEAPVAEPSRAGGPDRRGASLAIADLVKRFPTKRGDLTALDGVTIEAAPREVLGVVGPSGCGKSTLLELIAGLDEPSAGQIAVESQHEARERLRRCVLMPQRDLLLPWRSALDNAALALELAGTPRREARRRVEPLFTRFELGGFARAKPYELSGGMRQRVAFIRTLVAGKPILLLDEPFGSLDSITRADLQEWLSEALLGEPRTVVLVTHDVEEALYLCDRVVVLSRRPGRVRAEVEVPIPRPRPRRETVTDPDFVALRETALEALA